MPEPTRRDIIKAAAAASGAALLPSGAVAAAPDGLPMSAPVSVGRVGLLAREPQRLAAWYADVVGLRQISASGDTVVMGAGGVPLLEIIGRPGLRLAPVDEAGLFHTAFLLPARADLARWVLHAAEARLPVDGASDHLVSEALYLTDPEGNGVEIYADRAPESWTWSDGQVEMATLRLDFDQLLAAIGDGARGWAGAPSGTVVGHAHLKVGDAAKAGAWWQQTLGFDAVRARRGAVFLSTGRYHHHIAVNEWQTAGAGRREEGLTGLAFVELKSRLHKAPATHQDLWGTTIRIVPA